MANPEQLARLRQGVDVWNEWRRSPHEFFEVDLSGADLGQADLSGVDLKDADLTHAILFGTKFVQAKLSGASFSAANVAGADFSGADMTSASLVAANFAFVNFGGANLSYAILDFANLSGSDLIGANLSGVELRNTMLGDLDLRHTSGLDSVRHVGPSTIGIDTILLSKGEIPEGFLRGAGVPDFFITYIKSLGGSTVEFYSCFISYSTKDQEFADRLYVDLQSEGVRCWFAPHDIQGGRKIHEQIDEAIRIHDKLLLILSPFSMASEWVQTEISNARKREVRDKVRVLFPISLAPFQAIREWESFDADTGKDSAREIREYFIPDFSNWKDHDSYQKAFERLVRDLKAPAEKTRNTSSGA